MKYLKILAQAKAVNAEYGYLPYVLVTVYNISYPFTWIYVNEKNVSMAQNSIIRGLVGAVLNFMICNTTTSPTNIKQQVSYRLLVIRSVIMVIYSATLGLSQFILPLPITHTINSSGSILVFLIDYLINGIKINRKQAVGIFLGFIVVLITGNGKLIMSYMHQNYEQQTQFKHYITDDPIFISGFTLLFIIVMIGWAYGVTLTKKIHANTFQINFVMGLIVHFFGALVFPFTQNNTNYNYLFLTTIFSGIPINICQIIFIGSLSMTKNTRTLTIISFVSIVASYFVSIFRYGQKINIIVIFGIILVFIGVWRTVFNKDQ